ncbi:Secreted thaumatin-like protein calA [Penicillium maclennaniae]|uniref:Secreted thaumatin-like protein calA n=1 Tax=Penicillium maclennaniae TaxID=1343394 RepID=UPI0025408EE0|nr:Secreted thaumatin-like protein calA [Penicillium maclennaniae]KAJ5662179.1 Secreted thaumatin-like protein calA [Penicillium maclennaniae]
MHFFKTLGFLATIASTISALPQGLQPTVTKVVTLSPIATTATSTSTSSAPSTSAPATATSTASGKGIEIVNNLSETVYIWSTSNTASEMKTVASGDSYAETWRTNSDGGGISIKMSTSTSEESVLQFEYTKGDETLWWDLSSINLDSDSTFITAGFGVTTDDSSCSNATCAAGDTDCAESYQKSDDVDTLSCSSSAAFTMTLG